jgi:hypothetical protein
MSHSFEDLPRRIFLDSCTVQTLRNYGEFIYDGVPPAPTDKIHRITDGLANVEALQSIFLVNQRAQFEWIVSQGSFQEASDKRDPGHLQWRLDIADHSEVCLSGHEITSEIADLAQRLQEVKFGYLSDKESSVKKSGQA